MSIPAEALRFDVAEGAAAEDRSGPSLPGIMLICSLLVVLGVLVGGNPFLPLVGVWLAPTLWGLRRIRVRRARRLALINEASDGEESHAVARAGRSFALDLVAAVPHAFLVGLFGYYTRWGVNWSSGWLIALAGLGLAVASATLLLILTEAVVRVGILLRSRPE